MSEESKTNDTPRPNGIGLDQVLAHTSWDKPSDPAEKGVDQFQNHRAGYGSQYERVYRWAKAGNSLMAGEGAILVARIEELEAELMRLHYETKVK